MRVFHHHQSLGCCLFFLHSFDEKDISNPVADRALRADQNLWGEISFRRPRFLDQKWDVGLNVLGTWFLKGQGGWWGEFGEKDDGKGSEGFP